MTAEELAAHVELTTGSGAGQATPPRVCTPDANYRQEEGSTLLLACV